MKISKQFVLDLFAEKPEYANFDKSQAAARFALHENEEFTFSRFSGSFVTDSTQPVEIDEASFNAFKSSLSGSKWDKLVTSNGEDFVKRRYRMLSSCIVQEVFDFSYNDGEALKKAQKAGMFDDLRFFKDHNFSVDAIVGVVGKSFWDDSSVPGVDNFIFVNKTLDPVFAKKFELGIVDSVSVGISFKREKSHDFEDPFDFYALLGKEVDGSIVRFLVTEIIGIRELSSVAEGADPNAKLKFSKEDNLKELVDFAMNESNLKIMALQDTLLQKELMLVAKDEEIAELSSKIADFEKLSEQAQKFDALSSKFGEDLELLAAKGLDTFNSEKAKLVSFFRITGRSALAATFESTSDVKKIREFSEIFRDDIENAIPDVCPNCNARVNMSKQTSREPLATEEIVVKNSSAGNKNVDDFCNRIHQ